MAKDDTDRVSAEGFERRLFDLVVATADSSDPAIDHVIGEVLRLVREHLHMDVAFVSRFTNGQRVFRRADTGDGPPVIATGDADPIEASFCQRVIDGRLPQLVRDLRKLPNFGDLPPTGFPIGAHLSTPIVLSDGSLYGTLCCFSYSPNEDLTERDLKRLKMAAEMAARLLDKSRALGLERAQAP